MSKAPGALVYSRALGFLDAVPGMCCVLRAANQTVRIRIRYVVKPGVVCFTWPTDVPPRPSGWERWVRPVVRTGRLTVVDT